MKEKSVTIGVLSIQGSFAEHICALQKLDNVIARGHSITTGDQILTTYLPSCSGQLWTFYPLFIQIPRIDFLLTTSQLSSKRVGWNFSPTLINKQENFGAACSLPIKCPQLKARRMNFFLEKNKQACLFIIRDLRVPMYLFLFTYLLNDSQQKLDLHKTYQMT